MILMIKHCIFIFLHIYIYPNRYCISKLMKLLTDICDHMAAALFRISSAAQIYNHPSELTDNR